MIRVGLVGAGNQAVDSLIPAIRGVEHVDFLGICDLDRSVAQAAAKRSGVPHSFGGADAMLSSLELDAVVVACPPQAHEEVLRLAMAHGIPVFVEKPPATTTEMLCALSKDAREEGVLTGVGMNFRYATAYQHMRLLLRSGELGEPISVTFRHLANKPTASLWGMSLLRSVLLAQVIHPVDLVLDLMGQPTAHDVLLRRHGDKLTVVLRLSGASWVASIVSGTSARRFSFGIDVVTDQGVRIACDDLWDLRLYGTTDVLRDDDLPWTKVWSAGALDRGYSRAGYQGELREFLAAVASRGSFRPSLADLLPTYELLDSIEAAGMA